MNVFQLTLLCIMLFICLLSNIAEDSALQTILNDYVNTPIDCIWRFRKSKPNEKHPFIFFHQRKSGGTTLRNTLGSASYKLRMNSCIVGHAACGHSVFSVPWTNAAALYAGHFNWQSSMTDLPKLTVEFTSAMGKLHCQPSTFDCITNFRHPISRVESCIYERFVKRLKVQCINDIPIDTFTDILMEFRHKKGSEEFGCLNEQFRIFGTSDESTLASLGFDYDTSTKRVTPKITSIELELLSSVIKNIKQCVPLVLELSESKSILKSVFPLLYKRGAFNESVAFGIGKNGRTCAPLDRQHREVLSNLTSLEQLIYNSVVEKTKLAINRCNTSAVL